MLAQENEKKEPEVKQKTFNTKINPFPQDEDDADFAGGSDEDEGDEKEEASN